MVRLVGVRGKISAPHPCFRPGRVRRRKKVDRGRLPRKRRHTGSREGGTKIRRRRRGEWEEWEGIEEEEGKGVEEEEGKGWSVKNDLRI